MQAKLFTQAHYAFEALRVARNNCAALYSSDNWYDIRRSFDAPTDQILAIAGHFIGSGMVGPIDNLADARAMVELITNMIWDISIVQGLFFVGSDAMFRELHRWHVIVRTLAE